STFVMRVLSIWSAARDRRSPLPLLFGGGGLRGPAPAPTRCKDPPPHPRTGPRCSDIESGRGYAVLSMGASRRGRVAVSGSRGRPRLLLAVRRPPRCAPPPGHR